jgi:nucleotide-binding universal stress UspA family protein
LAADSREATLEGMKARGKQPMRAPVLVGVDDSVGAGAAVELGAWEAKRHQVPLLLVHGYQDRLPHAAYGLLPRKPVISAARDAAEGILEQTANQARSDHPGVTVNSTLVAGGGASTLVELSREASLVVVGSRGQGGFAGLMVGSVSAQVAMHSHAPVIVVRPGNTPGAGTISSSPVIVGVDGSAGSAGALAFAFDEAEARHVPLIPLFAWSHLPAGNLGPEGPLDHGLAQAREEASRMLAEAIAGWLDKYPHVRVSPTALYEVHPAWALIEASRRAGLLVVGSRGRGGFASLVLGSVSHSVIGHARCPVAVVRPTD